MLKLNAITKPRYFTPLMLAILLHILVLGFVFFAFEMPSKIAPSAALVKANTPTKIVNAITVNQKDIDKEVNRIREQNESALRQKRTVQRKLAQQKRVLAQQKARIAKSKAALAAQKRAQRRETEKLASQKKAISKQQAETDLQQKLLAEQQHQAAAAAKKKTAVIINKYNALILSAIYPNWIIIDKQKTLSADLLINLASNGKVLNVSIARGSGSTVFDQSAVAAVYKSSPLPVPENPQAFAIFKQFKLTLKPEVVEHI